MSFQILPNLIFLFAVLGIIILILRRVPQATGAASFMKDEREEKPEQGLRAKGVPAAALSQTRRIAATAGKKVWRFMLEAKGLSQSPKVNYQINKLLRRSGQEDAEAQATIDPAPAAVAAEAQPDESFYIDLIKRFPKDWQHYNNLGQFYLDNKNYTDALGVYEYLTKQDPASGEYWARLGYVNICLKNYEGAATSYDKSVGLDPSHPNRYYNLGLARIETGEDPKARAALEKAIELEPGNSKYQEALEEIKPAKSPAKK